MNIRDLKYVAAVAEHHHFGRAAVACHISQPALSGQIRKLEDELGVDLFERTNRRVRTTPAGEEIADHARRLLEIADLIEETATAHTDPLAGTLRLGMIPTIGPYLTPSLLPAIRRQLPNIELQVSETMTESLERQLTDGALDVAVIATPVEDAHLSAIALYDEPFWVALPHGHSLEHHEDVDVSEIATDDLLLLADGHCLRDQVLSFCPRNPNVSTHHTSLETVLALVGAGAGVTLVPAMSLRGSWVTDSGIALRRERTGVVQRSVSLAFRASFPRRAVVEKLADIICAILPDTVSPERR